MVSARVRDTLARLGVEFCAFCSKEIIAVQFSTHRDGFGRGPEVSLCDDCGGREVPSLPTIWATIGKSRSCLDCDQPIAKGEPRFGSYHASCISPLERKALEAHKLSKA